MPALLSTAVGQSGILIWTPDWMQNPFVVAVGLSGNIGTASVDYSLFDMNSVDVNGLATSNIATTWVNLIATAAVTSQMSVVNFTTPCQAIRLNVSSTVATSVVTLALVQATFGR
jgi:hypothetical protein